MSHLKKFLLSTISLVAFIFTSPAQAWEHEIAFGLGWGKEISENYNNSAVVLSGTFYKFKIDNTLFATIDGTLAYLHADTPDYNTLFTASAGLGFRAYFANPDYHQMRPYLNLSFGPAYISSSQFGLQQQGTNFDFQTTLGGGMEFALKKQHSIDVNLHLVHYCNAGLANPNQGYNVPFVLSVGYQF